MRNALPVPASRHGSPDPTGAYNHWDAITLDRPSGAASAVDPRRRQE